MQFDRDASGTLHPLPAPSIDTGAGLERLAAILQHADSNYHTDLFLPLLERVAEVVGRPYERDGDEGVAYRVLADHARAVAFLLADGVFPSNEGRGYVLRRILRRAVRYAWLLARREPTLVHVVDAVVDRMGDAYADLVTRKEHILSTTRAEEERFLSTIEGGLDRFDEIAPVEDGNRETPATVSGADAFRLYDTFGFPLDLTELMAEERGYQVDREGFEAELEAQRERSRKGSLAGTSDEAGETTTDWVTLGTGDQHFVGWDQRSVDTRVLSYAHDAASGTVSLILEHDPFYAEGGGQVSDSGTVRGKEWSARVDRVGKVGDKIWVRGGLTGELPVGESDWSVEATVDSTARHDTERNHTGTHLLHAALRSVLGTHVVQKGSLVDPDRLRFDFAHTAPMSAAEVEAVEARVNEAIFADHPVRWEIVPHADAVARGAMALFGERYGDEVRVVEIPEVSFGAVRRHARAPHG